ncbi:ribosome maturation factor RimP [uncultured Helicobacter sp.]|uniref:ribosome maturation factor RimP n=1 Tax=uncultured Helicobacter sp. TaxID=175537 RepID=UPI00261976D5|nr:ribosome maturation factor RimP [uncultured Helicobacter sp.]
MTLVPDLEDKIKKLVESLGFILYDILSVKENENEILRICITKPNTKENDNITLEDCQEVSLSLSPLLDVEMLTSKKYFLEVSSPGIERILKNQTHYKSAIGELVKIKTLDKQEFRGKLLQVNENALILENNQIILLDSIKKAQTYFEW